MSAHRGGRYVTVLGDRQTDQNCEKSTSSVFVFRLPEVALLSLLLLYLVRQQYGFFHSCWPSVLVGESYSSLVNFVQWTFGRQQKVLSEKRWKGHLRLPVDALLTFWRRNYFLNFSTPVYKMWIIQEPNTLVLWNKLHFEEEKKRRLYTMFKIFSNSICWINI